MLDGRTITKRTRRKIDAALGQKKEMYRVVTTSPNKFASQFHDRMPCALELEDVKAWLNAPSNEAAALMKPAKDVLQEHPLGKAINNEKNNGPGLLV